MEIFDEKSGINSQFFRAGVGVVVLNRQDEVLVLERSDVRGAWQFPQGGMREGEEPDQAVYRELEEETGLRQSQVCLIKKASQPLVYELPPHYRSIKTGRGQVHYWYLFRLTAGTDKITLGEKKEFKAWQWLTWEELLKRVDDFRKEVYMVLRREFSKQVLK
jgi:putative (di)nucleoside polyphosphate hydrolase